MSLSSVVEQIYNVSGCETFIRTECIQILRIDNDSYVIYNSKLNNPLYIESDAYEWIMQNPVITIDSYNNADEDIREAIVEFIQAAVYLPKGINEKDICLKKKRQYLMQFKTGRTFSTLDLRVSEACNFGCPHCIAASTKQNQFMTKETACKCVDGYINFKRGNDPNFSLLDIHFGNCEPLLNYPVIEYVVKYVKSRYPELQKTYSINTNLSLLTMPMARFFVENDIEVNSSIDGPRAGNDAIRMYKNGKGTYDDILRGYSLMAEAGRPLKGVTVTITDANYKFIDDEFFAWCLRMGFTSIGIDFDLLHMTAMNNDEKADFLAKKWRELKQSGVVLHGTWMTPFYLISNQSALTETYAFCKASEGRNLSVDSLGRIYACSFSDHVLSSFETLSEDINEGGSYYSFVEKRLLGSTPYAECTNCPIEGACNGQCEMTRNEATIQMIRSQCDFYRVVTRKMIVEQVKLLQE